MVSSNLTTEWKTYHHYMTKQPKENMKEQLKRLVSNEMLVTMFEHSRQNQLIDTRSYCFCREEFSQMKLIKTRLRSSLSDSSLVIYVYISDEDRN